MRTQHEQFVLAFDKLEVDEASGRLIIKTGYLAKQGRMLQKWKIRYFRLLDDRLQYWTEPGGDFLGQVQSPSPSPSPSPPSCHRAR